MGWVSVSHVCQRMFYPIKNDIPIDTFSPHFPISGVGHKYLYKLNDRKYKEADAIQTHHLQEQLASEQKKTKLLETKLEQSKKKSK